ncbi:MAG: linear amide C-N hydrolase [Parachlamydiales bacterium]|nr:linear amide C-N hydrolase [Parachlamydiales bacterium]
MATDLYIKNILPSQNFAIKDPISTEKITKFVHDHPTALKTIKVAIGLFILLSLALAILGFSAGSIPLAITASAIFAATSLMTFLAKKYLPLVLPFKHDMKNHVFKENSIDGAKLFYKNDVPILQIDTLDPYKAGFAQGNLLAKNIKAISDKWDLAMSFTIAPNAKSIPNVIKEVKKTIPEKFLKEMQGLVDGYNQWVDKKILFKPKKMTIEDAIFYHLIAEKIHFNMLFAEKQLADKKDQTTSKPNEAFSVACSSIVDFDENKKVVFARNMDWPSFDVAGTHTLVIKRNNQNGFSSSAEVTVPGLIGTLTGMNSFGLSVAMNITSGNTKKVEGMPSVFLNRICLQEAKTVKDAEKIIKKNKPLGPYHLTVADKKSAKTFHMYQNPLSKYFFIKFFQNLNKTSSLSKNRPIVVTNSRFDNNMGHYCERAQRILKLLKHANKNIEPENIEKEKILKEALQLPRVNNYLTTHRVMMYPEDLRMEVAFDNSFAGDQQLHSLESIDLF